MGISPQLIKGRRVFSSPSRKIKNKNELAGLAWPSQER